MPNPMKSFRDLTEEDKMSRVKDFSEQIAHDAAPGMKEYDAIKDLVAKTAEGIPPPPRSGSNKKKTLKFISMPAHPETDRLINEAMKLWGISRSSLMRYGLWLMFYKYGFVGGVDEVLTKGDRRALVRDSRVLRPFVHRDVAKKKWEKTTHGIRNYPGDNAKRPPGLHETGGQVSQGDS